MLPSHRLKKSNTIENLWVYVLFILKKRPIYGYEIPRLVEEEFNFKPGKITPYRILYQLENQDFVKSKIEGRRKIYKITKKGEEELKKARKFYKNLLASITRA